jgi:MFS-type transporter involved in bile tolerance (Atg22 family)
MVYLFVKEPQDVPMAYVAGVGLGAAVGGGVALFRAVAAEIIPKRQEAEFFGVYRPSVTF